MRSFVLNMNTKCSFFYFRCNRGKRSIIVGLPDCSLYSNYPRRQRGKLSANSWFQPNCNEHPYHHRCSRGKRSVIIGLPNCTLYPNYPRCQRGKRSAQDWFRPNCEHANKPRWSTVKQSARGEAIRDGSGPINCHLHQNHPRCQ